MTISINIIFTALLNIRLIKGLRAEKTSKMAVAAVPRQPSGRVERAVKASQREQKTCLRARAGWMNPGKVTVQPSTAGCWKLLSQTLVYLSLQASESLTITIFSLFINAIFLKRTTDLTDSLQFSFITLQDKNKHGFWCLWECSALQKPACKSRTSKTQRRVVKYLY